MKDINVLIEELIEYSKVQLGTDDLDLIYVRNLILHILNVSHPFKGSLNLNYIKNLKTPDYLIDQLHDYLIRNNFDNPDLIIDEIMGLLTPMPSEIFKNIQELETKKPGSGLDYLYNISIKNNYIKKSKIDKNIKFKKIYDDNYIEITINLSKPEKNNAQIAKLLTKNDDSKYPSCPLCIENMGFFGNINQSPKGNLRVYPIKLDDEDWFIQFSPYAYFDHHIIVINKNHCRMCINSKIFKKLLEFCDRFALYYIGSNADLPIVGGSILNHEHFQGGTYLLPMFFANERKIIYEDSSVKISILDWYNSVIKIESNDMSKVIEFSQKLCSSWMNYDNPSLNIISKSGEIRHSTITPIARKIGNVYQMNLILRNNRCDKDHPDGIFHANKKYHNIKQESIGLIEAMGLFILPARLKRQMSYVKELLMNDLDLNFYYEKYDDLKIHSSMIDELVSNYGRNLDENVANNIIKNYLADTCKDILIDTAVFKDDIDSLNSFEEFIKQSIF